MSQFTPETAIAVVPPMLSKSPRRTSARRRLCCRAVVCTLLLAGIFSLRSTAAEGESLPLVYTLQVRALHPATVEAIHTGAPLIDSVRKYAIGRISDIAVSPHMTATYNLDEDRMTLVPHPLAVDVILTVRAQGEVQASGCRIGGYLLTPGMTVSFTTPFFAGTGECITVAPVEEHGA